MAHRTFISYKYSEARDLRDRILTKLGSDASYYRGETSDSPDLSDFSTENIKRVLRDMMHNTSVTIVIISPNIKNSNWIDWEIEYSLKEITRKDRTSLTNGVVGVVMKYNGGYDWFITPGTNCHGYSTLSYRSDLVYPIIYENHFNSYPQKWHCDSCETYDYMTGSYIAYVEEDIFLTNPTTYIDNAYDLSNRTFEYKMKRQR